MSIEAEAHQIPAFIGGPRSGSTLMINLLGLHPQVAPLFETKCVSEALRWLRVLNNPSTKAGEETIVNMQFPPALQDFTVESVAARMQAHMRYSMQRIKGDIPSGKARYERYPLGHDYILYSLEEAESALGKWREVVDKSADIDGVSRATGWLITHFGTLQATYMGRPIWVNKTPELPKFGHELKQCVGRCRVIHMIRDGREVAASVLERGWTGDVSHIATVWKGMILSGRAAAAEGLNEYLEVRYEDLVSEPVCALQNILRFLHLEPLSQQLVDTYNRQSGSPISKEVKHSWRKLNDVDEALFNHVAGDLLAELDYPGKV